MEMPVFRVAILDLYNGEPNQGMRCIRALLSEFSDKQGIEVFSQEFDVRGKLEMADLSYDAYISTGGPGSPVESEGSEWERKYFALMDDIRSHNVACPEQKKPVFLICHSFQIYCRYYGLGKVSKRKSTSFGVMPIHCATAGITERYFRGMDDPFWAVDSRDWQVTQPDMRKIHEMGGDILCIEKYRPHIRLERCVMAMRFDDAIFGTQFHPEADPVGMLYYLKTEEKKKQVIEQHGEDKYNVMIDHLDDPDKIVLTYNTIIPHFLEHAVSLLKQLIS